MSSLTASAAPTAVTGSAVDRIGELRQEIDACDAEIIDLVRRRLAVSHEIGELRRATGGTRLNLSREQQVLSRFREALGDDGAALTGLQNLTIIAALPFALVMVAMAVSLVKDLRRDPIVLRGSYASLAIEQAVVDGISRHGDDFVLVVERTPSPAAPEAAAAPGRLSPELGGQPSVSPNGNFVAPEGTAALPAQNQPRAKAIGRPSDPRD
jgi:monofunctional chorismate mutase